MRQQESPGAATPKGCATPRRQVSEEQSPLPEGWWLAFFGLGGIALGLVVSIVLIVR